jgi:hypothetical protein
MRAFRADVFRARHGSASAKARHPLGIMLATLIAAVIFVLMYKLHTEDVVGNTPAVHVVRALRRSATIYRMRGKLPGIPLVSRQGVPGI